MLFIEMTEPEPYDHCLHLMCIPDSTSEDTEGKRVVTAAQRQKEREDKRKKKRVRANERVRRQKEKQSK